MKSLRHLRKENVNLSKWAKKWKAKGHNYFVIFYLSEGEINWVTTGSEEFIIKSLRGNLPGENIPPVIISINITEIIRRLEKKTGDKF